MKLKKGPCWNHVSHEYTKHSILLLSSLNIKSFTRTARELIAVTHAWFPCSFVLVPNTLEFWLSSFVSIKDLTSPHSEEREWPEWLPSVGTAGFGASPDKTMFSRKAVKHHCLPALSQTCLETKWIHIHQSEKFTARVRGLEKVLCTNMRLSGSVKEIEINQLCSSALFNIMNFLNLVLKNP